MNCLEQKLLLVKKIFFNIFVLGNNVYGIKLKNQTIFDNFGTNEKHLNSFTTAVLPFYLVADYENTDVMIEWQHAAIRFFEQPQYSNLLKVFVLKKLKKKILDRYDR